jgi:hypothetical protein
MKREHVFVLCHPELGSGSRVSGLVDLFDDPFGASGKEESGINRGGIRSKCQSSNAKSNPKVKNFGF